MSERRGCPEASGPTLRSSMSQSSSTISRFRFSLWPPMLYDSPGRPSLSTRTMASQWSSTYSQSRTLPPSP